MRNSKRSSSTDHSFLVCMHYHLCQFSGFLTRQCSSSHTHFHCYHSPSRHSLLLSENKSPLVITTLVGYYRHSITPPTLSHSSFILCGVIIIKLINPINLPQTVVGTHKSSISYDYQLLLTCVRRTGWRTCQFAPWTLQATRDYFHYVTVRWASRKLLDKLQQQSKD